MADDDHVPMPSEGVRLLSFGLDDALGRAAERKLREAGVRATVVTVSDDERSDARVREALASDRYDAVGFGAGLNGQNPEHAVPDAASTAFFNRLLNVVHAAAPEAKLVLARSPQDMGPALERELGRG